MFLARFVYMLCILGTIGATVCCKTGSGYTQPAQFGLGAGREKALKIKIHISALPGIHISLIFNSLLLYMHAQLKREKGNFKLLRQSL